MPRKKIIKKPATEIKEEVKEPALVETPKKMKKQRTGVITTVLVLALSLLVIFYLAYYFYKPTSSPVDQNDPEAAITEISKFMDLPENEKPQIATILDKDQLQDQPFFSKAQNGDILIIYEKAAEAIIWRPSTQRIIQIGPITKATEPESVPLKIVYYNGTYIAGLASKIEKTVEQNFPSYQTLKISNATNRNYSTNIVVNLSGVDDRQVQSLAKLLNAQVSPLPNGEIKPDADILIIVGQ